MAETYKVYRDSEVVAENLTEKSYTDTGLTPATTYQYQVNSVNEAGESPLTAALQVTTDSIAVTGIALDKTTDSIAVGANDTLVATIAPSNATDKAVTWTTTDETIATVDTTGKVTGVAAGTCNIVATSHADGTKKATCAVTITAA
jgi:uncharacterized protein YjdB